jgi:hypothetical protein
VAAGVEVADEIAEPVLEFDVPAVCALIVDQEDAEIFERALEHTAASTPRRARGRELIERVGTVGNPKTIDTTEHIVERVRRDRRRSRSLAYRCRHTFEFTPDQPQCQREPLPL